MATPSPPPTVPWAFVIALIVVGSLLAVVLGYWGAIGQIGHPIPGTHGP
jgi:hypothetical protein